MTKYSDLLSEKNEISDSKKYSILFVDDEEEILKTMVRIFRKENYTVLTADSAIKAWQILKEKPISIIVTDYRMPKVNGIELMKKVKTVYPDTIRIMLTGYADIDSVMEAINQGAVYKFIAKPWNDEDLKVTIRLALVQYNLLRENRRLKAVQKQQMKNIDKLSKFINKSQLGELLLKNKLAKKTQLKKAIALQIETGETFPAVLIKMGVVEEDLLIQRIQDDLGIRKLNLDTMEISPAVTSIIPREVCLNNGLVPVKKTGNVLTIAMVDPSDQMKIDALKFMTGLKIDATVALQKEINDKIDAVYGAVGAPEIPKDEVDYIEAKDSIVVVIGKEDEHLDIKTLFTAKEQPSAVTVVNAVIADALRQHASDVHIEPKNQYVMVRHRIDGLLFDKLHIPLSLHPAIVSRIKVMAELDISEKRRPQDGRITIKTSTRMVDARLSTLPTIAGEKIVFRILDRNSSIKDIDEIGLSDDQIELVTQLIKKPQGCILVTGPTGSGKTSTLYSLIQKTATIHKNYSTIEDPVEYYMNKAEQVMIKEKIGLTFPVVLRSLLRQDPDIIMLGEIRDFETAEVAFHAALTGHTVLSTLHTNSCIATITRLLDMGVKPYVLSSALNGVVSQRLVRRICTNCMVDDIPSKETINLLGLAEGTRLNAKKGRGCEKCNNTGYKDRTGIYEVFNINSEIELLLQQQATEAELKKAATLAGIQTLFESGMNKISMGITTCDEVLRVLGPQNLFNFKCRDCGKIMKERFNFCPFCASMIHPRCSTCDRSLESGWKACPDCGSKVQEKKGG